MSEDRHQLALVRVFGSGTLPTAPGSGLNRNSGWDPLIFEYKHFTGLGKVTKSKTKNKVEMKKGCVDLINEMALGDIRGPEYKNEEERRVRDVVYGDRTYFQINRFP